MADFDGDSFVGIDDDGIGSGDGDLTRFLDSALEASVRAQNRYLRVGYDEFSWSEWMPTEDRTAYLGSRPRASLDWMTVMPFFWVPVMPYLTAIDVRGDYAVYSGSEETDLDFDCKLSLVGFGQSKFELENTFAAGDKWGAFQQTITIAQPIQNPTWSQIQFWGRSRIGGSISASTSGGDVTFQNSVIDGGGVYGVAGTTGPTADHHEVQCTRLADGYSQGSYYDHVCYDQTNDAIVLNPPIDARPSASGYSHQTYGLSYLMLRGVTFRLRYAKEL